MTAPNIVLLVLDTARVDTAYDAEVAPVLSTIAENGTRFENCISSSPWTLPSHSSLFTGCTPSKTGAHAEHKRLDGKLTTLAEALRDAGYETVAVSNNTWVSDEFGFSRGFETFRKNWQYAQSQTDFGAIARQFEGAEMYRHLLRTLFDGNPAMNLLNVIYGKFIRKRGDDGAARTNEWIDDWIRTRDDDRPFFLFVNYLEPHLEYRPIREHTMRFLPDGISYDEAMEIPQNAWEYIAGKVELTDTDFEILRALYRAEISYVDEQIAEVQKTLVRAGEWEDTLFVVTADHGENIGDHGLMDHQYCLYDTLIHVPLVVHGGPFDGGERNENLVQLLDIFPTLLDATDIDQPDTRQQIQGRSFHPDAAAEPRKYAFAEYIGPQPSMNALRERVGTLPEQVLQYDRSLRSIRSQEWKLIRGSDGARELYRISTDGTESEDVAENNPEVVETFETELDEWLQSFDEAEPTDAVSMSDETKNRLEELGYLQ